jgi:surface antigen
VLALALPIIGGSAQASTTETAKATHKPAPPARQAQVTHPVVRHGAIRHEVARHETAARHVVAEHPAARQVVHTAARTTSHTAVRHAVYHTAYHSGWMSCVPYARSESGITLAGNAWQWWDHAEGVYQRGMVPEPGSVLNFRANGRMRLGHVAVVSKVINDREIEVDHANWGGEGIMHNVPVVDVSENNDWTAVRVGLGRGDSFGSVYPTYGFIYDRPDTGKLLVAITVPAPTPSLNRAPSDLRTAAERTVVAQAAVRHYDEVAEAPATPRQTTVTTPPVDRH